MSEFTPGPWAWFGNTEYHRVYLATPDRGRRFVMDFTRYGMQRAQPRFQVDGLMVPASELVVFECDYRKDVIDINHPDARLIVAAPDLYRAAVSLLLAVPGTQEEREARGKLELATFKAVNGTRNT